MRKKSFGDFGLAIKIPNFDDYFGDEFGVFGDDYRNAKPFKKSAKKYKNREAELFAGYQPFNDKEALEQDKYGDRNYNITGYDGYNITGKLRQQ